MVSDHPPAFWVVSPSNFIPNCSLLFLFNFDFTDFTLRVKCSNQKQLFSRIKFLNSRRIIINIHLEVQVVEPISSYGKDRIRGGFARVELSWIPIDENQFFMDPHPWESISQNPINENRLPIDRKSIISEMLYKRLQNRFSWTPIVGKSMEIHGISTRVIWVMTNWWGDMVSISGNRYRTGLTQPGKIFDKNFCFIAIQCCGVKA